MGDQQLVEAVLAKAGEPCGILERKIGLKRLAVGIPGPELASLRGDERCPVSLPFEVPGKGKPHRPEGDRPRHQGVCVLGPALGERLYAALRDDDPEHNDRAYPGGKCLRPISFIVRVVEAIGIGNPDKIRAETAGPFPKAGEFLGHDRYGWREK